MACKNEIGARVAPHRLLVLVLLFVSLLAGCGSESGGGKTPTKPDPARATFVSLSSSAVALEAIGATHQLSATVKDQNGQTMSGASVQWSSSNPAVASVGSTGSVTSVGVGNATITARSGTVSATVTVDVTQVVVSLVISAPTSTLHELGATLQFTAEVRDAKGHAIPSAQATWASSDPDCVAIDAASGLATAMGFGTATISATSGPASSTSDLPVVYIPSSGNELLSFSFQSAENPGLAADAEGEIDAEDVVLLIPQSVDATSLIASFAVSPGATVQVDGLDQVAAETEQDFTAVLRYTVISEDQSQTSTYTVYVGRLLDGGESIGWQRDSGRFRYSSAPGDIMLLEDVRIRLDSVFPRLVDTLHATPAETIRIDIFPSHAAFLDKMRELGDDPQDWWTGAAFSSDWIMMVSPNSPDLPGSLDDLLSTVTHEGLHAIIHSFGTPVSIWTHEGLTNQNILAACFPDCELDWNWQRSVVASFGKPPLDLMFIDPAVGYGFAPTTVIFIVKKFGWDALRTFLTDPTEFSVFGGADHDAFEAEWHDFLDELWGVVVQGPRSHSISEARAMPPGLAELVSVEGTVTWQLPWDDRIYFLQDETGGISTFHPGGPISLEEGDRIRITGLVAEHRGEIQMTPITNITVLSHGPVPTPRAVTAAQINGGQFQGELVEVQGVVQELTELAFGNQKVTIRDASGTDFPVYVDSRTGMVAGDWPAVGTTVRVVGVLGTDDRTDLPQGTGPRVEVRRKADVTVSAGPSPESGSSES